MSGAAPARLRTRILTISSSADSPVMSLRRPVDGGGASRKVLQLARWSAQIVKLFEAMHLPPGPDAGCFWPASGPQKRPPIVEDNPRIHAWYAVLRRMSTCCSGATVRVHVCI